MMILKTRNILYFIFWVFCFAITVLGLRNSLLKYLADNSYSNIDYIYFLSSGYPYPAITFCLKSHNLSGITFSSNIVQKDKLLVKDIFKPVLNPFVIDASMMCYSSEPSQIKERILSWNIR